MIIFTFLLGLWGGIHKVMAGENLALLVDSGDLISISPDGKQMILPLFCEGDTLCGSATIDIQQIPRFDEQQIQLLTDALVCKCPACPDPVGDPFCQTCINPSCVMARNALFVEDAIPEIPQPDGNSYAATMTQHDPIQCTDVSGIFAPDGCAGNLKLDYRCLVVFNLQTQKIVRTFFGSFIISTKAAPP
jgi:hypothetical protein